LAEAGKSVLVIDKGAYVHESEFVPHELTSAKTLYDFGGFATSIDGSISILAGSVFGGGTTVNWSASLKVKTTRIYLLFVFLYFLYSLNPLSVKNGPSSVLLTF
jgi:hypothetical protein